MKIKKLRQTYIRYSLILMCIFTFLSSWAGDYEQDGIQYKIYEYNSKAVVVGVEDPDIYEAKIEESVCGYPVTGIATGAFSSCTNLYSITIPSSVTSIAKKAFYGCNNLASVTITSSTNPYYEGLSIGEEAFYYCNNLDEVTINSSVSSIGERAFYGSNIRKFTIASSTDSSVELSIENEAFMGCNNLESFTSSVALSRIGWRAFSSCTSLSSFVAPSEEKSWYYYGSIEYCAFEDCTSLSSITIPSSVIGISECAFAGCTSLSSVTIPSSVEGIDGSAFVGCSSLTSFDVAQENPKYSSFMGTAIIDKEEHTIVCVAKNTKDFIFPSSVTSIGSNAFQDCSSLASVTIPSSVNSIGSSAFSGCSSLASVTIPSSVNSIGGSVFEGCSSLASITIPSSVTSIGYRAFYGCSSLASVTIPSSVTSIDSYAFKNCSSLTSVTIPSSVTSIGSSAFEGCSSLASVTIPSSVNSIGSSAFYDCSSLASVTIPSSVTSIKEYTFYDCSSLASVTIPSSVTSIGERAFQSCSSLASVTIPSSVTSIKEYTFYDCSSLASVTIPSSVTSIGERAFQSCSSLASVTIPSSVTSIGECAFQSCSSLASVTIPSSVTSIKEYTFYDCSSLASVTIPSSVTSIGARAFLSCSSLTSVTIPSSVTSIGEYAFSGCSSLISFYIFGDLGDGYSRDSWSLSNPWLVMFDYAISEDSPWYDVVSGSSSKGNDYYTMYFRKNYSISNKQKKLTDDYLNAKELAGSYKEEYESLKEDQRKLFDGLVNPAHLFASLHAEESVMTAYNDSLLEACDMLLEWVNENWYNPLNTTYKQVVQTMTVTVRVNGSYNDSYSANDGLITDASQFSSNAKESTEGSYEGLIDNDRGTFFHSEWTSNNSQGAYHYLQIDLRDTYENIVLKYSIRQRYLYGYDDYYYSQGTPKTLHVYVTNTVDDENAWVDLGRYTCTYDFSYHQTGLLYLDFAEPYRYVRLVVEETMGNSGRPYFYWSELHAYPRYQAASLESVLSYVDRSVIDIAKSELERSRATKQTYQKLQALLDKLNKTPRTDFSKSSYLTLYSDKALVVPEGIKAAVVVSNGNGISCDYRYEAGSVIPANTGVLIKGGKGNSFLFTEGETTEVSPADNLLHGTLSGEMTHVEGDNKYYKLAYDNATGTQLGFYWGAEDGAPFLNMARKAYLAIPVTTSLSQSMQGFSLNDLNNGVTTGLAVPTTTNDDSLPLRIYDLNGRRINAQSVNGLQPGIYVVNGKKMYVK